MSGTYAIEYKNENEYRKKERTLKKYNMLAYKKLIFEIYPNLREGNFNGIKVNDNTKEGYCKYELKLPTDRDFEKIHEAFKLHYTIYKEQNVVMLDTLTPEDILTEGVNKELKTYKGVLITKSHAEKDMFKINLLNSIRRD